jgi:hypothetical protein
MAGEIGDFVCFLYFHDHAPRHSSGLIYPSLSASFHQRKGSPSRRGAATSCMPAITLPRALRFIGY